MDIYGNMGGLSKQAAHHFLYELSVVSDQLTASACQIQTGLFEKKKIMAWRQVLSFSWGIQIQNEH
jgi:hypothetical protein